MWNQLLASVAGAHEDYRRGIPPAQHKSPIQPGDGPAPWMFVAAILLGLAL